jgi:hypothetical protein
MQTIDIPVKLDFRFVRPQQLERLPLSGKTVRFRSHSGGGISFRGKEYRPDADGVVEAPIEAIQQHGVATFWPRGGKSFQVAFDIIEEPPKENLV